MIWQKAIAIISSLALLAPVVIILFAKLYRYKSYLALFVYCFMAFIYNLMTEDYIDIPGYMKQAWGITNNVLDAPLILTFLIAFTTSKLQRKIMRFTILAFICFELGVIAWKGYSIEATIVIMGPGISVVFAFALYFFVRYIGKVFMYSKVIGKTLMISAICFAYGCFTFLYILYYLMEIHESPYIYLIYFVISIIYCSFLLTGLLKESKRKKRLEDLLVTRKELQHFFADEKKPATPKKVTGLWKLN
jgi:hypothetical protein